jgi:hypothetical protein
MLCAHALLNACQGLCVALKGARDNRFKFDALSTPVLSQAQTLLLAQGAELVVVIST